jgi:uncharacterized alpha/beta hydrolase family protein
MSDEPDKPKASSWIAFWIVMGALFGFAVLSRVFNSPNTDAPKNSGGVAPPIFTRIQFGADKAVAIAIEEVKKREGWSGKPDWANVDADEALTWDGTVRRGPRRPVVERLVVVSAATGKVLSYSDPSASR